MIVNILDNAINAASASETENPYIKLDLHCKNNYFVFSCENSTHSYKNKHKKISAPEHGYGSKTINQIMKKYGDMISVEKGADTFKISIAVQTFVCSSLFPQTILQPRPCVSIY